MNLKYFYSICFGNQKRLMSNKKLKSHYDSLGISPKATQGEVKSAYYKLSMTYHPDKNKGNQEHSQKFRDISEAYEVLGNIKTRKFYDRGLYGGAAATDDTINKFYKSRETRSRPPPPSGRTIPVYDFDEWSKNHYGATFQRQMENKRKTTEYKINRTEQISHSKKEAIVLGLLVLLALGTSLMSDTNYDIVNMGNRPLNTHSKDSND